MIISKHAEERYAERIMSYDEKVDRSIFIAQHKDKIEKDLNKMKEFGTLLYSGKSLKDNLAIVDIYLKDTWVLLVDKNKDTLITLYKIDLKVDEEFTEEYVKKILNKLELAKEENEKVNEKINTEISQYRELISENDLTITDLRKTVKSLEEQNEAYRNLINNLTTNKKLADDKVREVLMILTGNKIW